MASNLTNTTTTDLPRKHLGGERNAPRPVQSLHELMGFNISTSVYGNVDEWEWNCSGYQLWDFSLIQDARGKTRNERIQNCLPDLPRIPTANELDHLNQFMRSIIKKNLTGQYLWFFDNSVADFTLDNRYWPYSLSPSSFPDGTPFVNTYTIRNYDGKLYYHTNATRFARKNTYTPTSVGYRLMKHLDSLTIQQLLQVLRNNLITLWCSVPYKKGTHVKTVVKKLFDFLPEDQKPPLEQQQLFIDTLLDAILDLKRAKAERKKLGPQLKIEQRKHIQHKTHDAVLLNERRIQVVTQRQLQITQSETLKLQRLQQKYEEQLRLCSTLQEKHQLKQSKLQQSLSDAQNARAATLLSGVSKSLNQHYKNIYDSKITHNPFTQITSDTFIVTQLLLDTPKI